MPRALTSLEIDERISRVATVGGRRRSDFAALIAAAGLDPRIDLRFENWSGSSFAGLDLTGYDFTGAVLAGCNFTGASIAGARFTQAELGIVWDDPDLTGAADLSKAKDFHEAVRAGASSRLPKVRMDSHLSDGALFVDALSSPLMVVIGLAEERDVTADAPLAGRLAVSLWNIGPSNADELSERGSRPIGAVFYGRIAKYLQNLNMQLGLKGRRAYRLLSESEWEYCARPAGKIGRHATTGASVNVFGLRSFRPSHYEVCRSSSGDHLVTRRGMAGGEIERGIVTEETGFSFRLARNLSA